MIEKSCENCGVADGARLERDKDGKIIKCPGIPIQGLCCKEWVKEVNRVDNKPKETK